MKIYIRNMACESCKAILRDALIKLNLNPIKIELGEAEIKGDLTEYKKNRLDAIINKVGLQLVENKGEILIEEIKKNCLEYAFSDRQKKINISDFLSLKLNKDYKYLSNVFSEVELCTIVHYINMIKMEKAKEMILFEDHNFSEIAAQLNYNNLASFSTQFKKITGFSPSHFKKLKHKSRLTIQELTQNNK